ncbi:biopolymer transporter ExbD [Maricaulaceae bacterium EIL42A08]|nr:biopolymer transporter ExbD [Maricaulaceae bacterium EIL42A08]MCP2678216.1 biopolymer transporter ExbD [Maricaulaceae bacterium NA33B04]
MARRNSRVMSDEEEVELDMTPMLDVVFILLIFFIVTAVFVKEPGELVERPDTEAPQGMKPTLLVAVSADDEIWIDGNVYELRSVRPVLEQLLEENPRAEAMIQGDAEAPIGTVLDIQELLMELDVEVLISTDEAS